MPEFSKSEIRSIVDAEIDRQREIRGLPSRSMPMN